MRQKTNKNATNGERLQGEMRQMANDFATKGESNN
jgi:hypothetical protein